jgi:uncharacterized coiled-coil protein SlyX
MPMANISMPLETSLAAVERGVNALLTAMNLVVDTLQQQTNLLEELAAAAKEPTGESPVVEAIDTLTGAVLKMGEGIDALRVEMDELPDRLKTALTDEVGEPSGDAAAPLVP